MGPALTNVTAGRKLVAPVSITSAHPTALNGYVGRGVFSLGIIGSLALIGGLYGPLPTTRG